MKISFVWKNNPPQSESKSDIEKSFAFGLDHHPDTRNRKPEKLLVRLIVDKPQTTIDGIGYNPEGKAIFKSSYSLVTRQGDYSYYGDSPQTET